MGNVRGWSFPIQVEGNTGRIKEVGEQELIAQSIKMILQTNINERIIFPNFGCGLQQFVFTSFDYAKLQQIEAEVKRSLARWEPRIEVLQVLTTLAKAAENILKIELVYKIANMEAEIHYLHEVNVG